LRTRLRYWAIVVGATSRESNHNDAHRLIVNPTLGSADSGARRPPTTPTTPRQVLNCCAAARAAAALEKPPTSPAPPASVSYRTAHDERPVLATSTTKTPYLSFLHPNVEPRNHNRK